MYTQVFAYKKCSDGSLTPELHGRLRIIVHSNDRLHPVLFSKEKNNAALIFTVPYIIAKFAIKSGTVKIGLASLFSASTTHRRHDPYSST